MHGGARQQQPMLDLVCPQCLAQLTVSVLDAVALIEDEVCPLHGSKPWSILLVDQEVICRQENIEALLPNLQVPWRIDTWRGLR